MVGEPIDTEYGLQKVFWIKTCRREVELTRGRLLQAHGACAKGRAAAGLMD